MATEQQIEETIGNYIDATEVEVITLDEDNNGIPYAEGYIYALPGTEVVHDDIKEDIAVELNACGVTLVRSDSQGGIDTDEIRYEFSIVFND